MKVKDLFNFKESYSNDVSSKSAKILDDEFYLTVKGYEKEQSQLVAEFPISDSDVVKAIRDYTKASTLNKALATGATLSAKAKEEYDMIMSLKKLGCSLKEKHNVYSGTGLFDPLELIKNKVFKTPSFISASLNIAVAVKTNNFRREQKQGETDHLLHFILPKGYKGCFYIGPYSTDPAELEMLIFPNQKFELIKSQTLELNGVTRNIHTLEPAK